MVLRQSNSSWSVCPETIMSHHYRLTKGVKPVIDTSPPYSMHNSPISVHYIPKRASSADAIRRNANWVSRPHRELSAFIQAHSSPLRLPLSLRDSRNDHVKAKLLNNRNYQPPQKKPPQAKPKPPLPYPAPKKVHTKPRRADDNWLAFKDAVFSLIIQRSVFTDRIIVDTVESEMERWIGTLPWTQLEMLRDEIYEEFTVKDIRPRKSVMIKRSSSMGSVSESSTSTSSASSSKSSNASTSSSKSTRKNSSFALSEISSAASSTEEQSTFRSSYTDSDDD